jgi:outer membrane protein
MRYLMLAVALPSVVLAQTPRPITLEEAVKLAQKNSPTTVQAKNTVALNQSAVRTAWGQFLPSLTLNSNANHSGGNTFFQGQLVPYRGAPWSYSRGLSSSLRLFDAGQRNYNLSAARANVHSAEVNERAQEYTVATSVAQQYYNALAAREAREAAQAQLEQAQEGMKSANARVAAGAATKSDSLRSVITVGQAQLAVLTAENNLQIANASLTRLVATPFIITPTASDSLGSETFAVDSAELVKSVDAAPTVAAAQSALSAARSSVRASRTRYFPTVSLSMGLNENNTTRSWTGQYSQSQSFGFSFNFPLFDNFTREGQIVSASVQEDNAVATLRDAKFLTQQQLVQYLGNLRLAEAQIQIQQASIESAQEDLRVQQQRYALGATTLLELLTSQTTLNNARNSLISARRDARIAKANLSSLLGLDIK